MLTSFAPVGLALPQRPDLYHLAQFGRGGRVAWQPPSEIILSTAQARRELRALLDCPRTRSNTLAALSAMDGWGIFSNHHLALMTGNTANLREASKALSTLLRLGILDLGAPHLLNPRQSPVRFFRRRMGGPLGRLASVMTEAEDKVVRGAAASWNAPSGHDRHDLLAVEFVLRAAEYHRDIMHVAGERHTKARLLQSPPSTGSSKWNHRGDGILTRDDGVRFVVELTASRTEKLQQKIERWCRWLEANPVQHTGVVVLWVCAPDPVRGAGMSAAAMRTMLTNAFRSHPSRSKGKPIGRMAVVQWNDWFPAARETSDDFEDMTVWMMGAMRQWHQVSLAKMSWPTDPIESSLLPVMGHGPCWLSASLG
ncbi:hypothetical protein [Glutamicibacter sp. NPDC087344]|uniref:hypothetical protein n=1 Tax=Glutamicibacter sp. NPDC087344 TaxID=3363994 RepID=UPI00381FD12B